jgi:hypothetical protein
MNSIDLLVNSITAPSGVKELAATFAERKVIEEQERAHQRRLGRVEQSSDLNSPDVRISAWEKLHGLRLPSDPMHPVLDVVAISTRLTLAEVQEVQRRRAERTAANAASQAAKSTL